MFSFSVIKWRNSFKNAHCNRRTYMICIRRRSKKKYLVHGSYYWAIFYLFSWKLYTCVYQMGAITDHGCSQAIANVGRFSMRNAVEKKKKRQLKWTEGETNFCSQFRKSVINMQCKISMSNLFHIYILKREFNNFSVFFRAVKEFQIVKAIDEEKKNKKWTILITCWEFPGIW